MQHIDVDDIVLNPRLGDDLFRIPKLVAETAAKQKAPEEVNIQWMLRRANWGSFIDSDALAYDPALVSGNVWTEVKPGIWHITGGSHNTLVVEMKDHLVAFDAPIGNEMSRLTIAEAERRFPGKPFKYLVLTHHHMDHVNGARVFAAKGADLVFGPGDREMFAQQMQAPNRIRNDELVRRAAPRRPHRGQGQADADRRRAQNRSLCGRQLPRQGHADRATSPTPISAGRSTSGARPATSRASSRSHKEFVAGLRQIGIMPTIWAGGHGTGAAPIKPLVDALDKMSARNWRGVGQHSGSEVETLGRAAKAARLLRFPGQAARRRGRGGSRIED